MMASSILFAYPYKKERPTGKLFPYVSVIEKVDCLSCVGKQNSKGEHPIGTVALVLNFPLETLNKGEAKGETCTS